MKALAFFRQAAIVCIAGFALWACDEPKTPVPVLPTVKTYQITDLTTSSALAGGAVSDNGGAAVTAYGFVWSETPEPTTDLDTKTTMEGEPEGDFTGLLTGLKANTTYHYRAYATNEAGTAYGEELTLTTNMQTVIPTVVTYPITDLTTSSALAGGTVSDNGGAAVTAYGFVWSETPEPTTDLDTKTTMEGEPEGDFTGLLTGLKANTAYHYRAYATNEAGTAYGDDLTFTTANHPEKRTFKVGSQNIELVLVDGGTFHMGATEEYEAFAQMYEKPVHRVTLDSYYMATTEVSQALWEEVMGTNPSMITINGQHPVNNVSYRQCEEFIKALNERTGVVFSLPTEAQWEYAARGGQKANGYIYSGSNDATEVGWVAENTKNTSTRICGTKASNELGIYDMTGNVREWCSDGYALYTADDQTNPTGAGADSQLFVIRGGSFMSEAQKYCYNAKRMYESPLTPSLDLGMRLVMNINE